MECKGYSPHLCGKVGQRSIRSCTTNSSGCNIALIIAYKHLKEKFAAQKAELKKYRQAAAAMSGETEDQALTSTVLLERKVEQLQKSLQSKTAAYNNLESSYKQTRENEESLQKHTTETEQMLFELTGKCQGFQEDMQELTKKISKLEEENTKLKDELLEHKNIPEVAVHREATSGPPRSVDSDDGDNSKHTKQIRALLDENKTLKTNMYWLTKELKTVKNKDELSRRIRLDSGGLEEGRGRSRCSDDDNSKEICKCMKSIVSYVRKLERTVCTLKLTLDKNNIIINDLLLKKYGHIPKVVRSNDALATCKLTESYVTINGDGAADLGPSGSSTTHECIWDSQDEEIHNLPELESASVIVPLEQTSSEDDEEDEDDDYLNLSVNRDVELARGVKVSFHKHKHVDKMTTAVDANTRFDPGINNVSEVRLQQTEPTIPLEMKASSETAIADPGISPQTALPLEEQPEHNNDPLNTSYGDGMLKNRNCPCNLPLALIQNLQMQRTETYLTSKKSNEKLYGGSKDAGKTALQSPLESPIGSPSHAANRNVAEMFERKNTTGRKGYPMEINS